MDNNFMKDDGSNKRKLFANKKLNTLLLVVAGIMVVAVLGVVIWLNVA